MSIRLDWPHISGISSALGSPDALFLVAIPLAARDIFLTLLEPLSYEATWRVSGYDYSDFEQLQDILEDTARGLMEAEKVETIVNELDRIATALEAMQADSEGSGDSLGIIADVVTAIDPKLGIMLQILDSIDDVLGGVFEP
jgi:hypothetical protein